MFLLFGIGVLFAINKAWIKLSFGGDTSFNVLFIVEYQFVLELHFHWMLGNIVIHEYVVYHVYHCHYVTFSGNFKS